MKALLLNLEQQAGRLYTAWFSALLTRPYVFPIVLFVLAFSIRATYLLASDHRILQFGDAFYYLTTGAELAKAIGSFTDWNSFLQHLTVDKPISTEATSTFLSVSLPVRIILDGPIYPAYLALIASLFGFAAQEKPQFDAHCIEVSLANSFVDAVSCLLIYSIGSRAFGRKVGAVAGLLFAFYPPASINLARAYSENFAYFMVLALVSTVLLARTAKLNQIQLGAVGLATGLLIVAVTLVRPVFFLVVASILFALLFSDWINQYPSKSQWHQAWWGKRRLTALAVCVAAVALFFYPWVSITTKSLGKPAFLVNRAPAYNLFVGNQLISDGWKTWPMVNGYDGNIKRVVNGIIEDFLRQPAEMTALEFKKLPRLWAGGWNEFRYPFFGIASERQNVWHSLLLFFAFMGIALTAARVRAERSVALTFVATSAALIICTHFIYVAFEPISRYAITAMPFVSLFAAYAIVALLRQRAIVRFLILGGFAAIFFSWLHGKNSLAPIIFQNFPTMGIINARLVEELIVLVVWFWLAHMCVRAMAAAAGSTDYKDSPVKAQSRNLIFVCFGLAAASWFSAAHFDQARCEWSCGLRTEMQTISQEEAVPPEKVLAAWLSETKGENALDPTNTVFLLVDFESEVGQPGISLTINRTPWRTVAMPWYQVLGKEGDIPTILNMQGNAMTKDWRTFRQWWAIPIPRGLLVPGKSNEIAIGFAFAESPVTIRMFGDYFAHEETDTLRLPSFELFSWTRGFATYDTRDMRIYEQTPGLSKVSNPALWFSRVSETTDLSTEPGLQSGAYRIRIAVPRKPAGANKTPAIIESTALTASENAVQTGTANSSQAAAQAAVAEAKLPELPPEKYEDFAPTTIAKKLEDVTIDGANPLTYALFKESCKLPNDLKKGTIIDFGCLLKSDRKRQSGPILVRFEGVNEKGELEKLDSPWCPTAVSCDRGWRRFHASYVVPDQMLKLKNLAVNIVFNPFSTDELILHRAKACTEVLVVKDANLVLFAPIKMPEGKQLDWMIF